MIKGLLLSIVCTLGVLRVVLTPTDQKDIIYRLARPYIRPNNLEPDWITCQASILKSTKWHIPQKKPRTAVLSYLCILLISLSSDIEANPGPTDYPCGPCAVEVQNNDPALEFDDFGQWLHIQCESIGQNTYDDWVNTDRSFSWVCSGCGNANYSNLSQNNSNSFTSRNSYSILSEESSDSSIPSSPSLPRPDANKTF